MTQPLRLVVIGAGNVGGIAVRAVQGRRDIELVGVWSRATAVGTDAGMLDTDRPCGVVVTDSIDEIMATKPDVALMALNIRDPAEAQRVNGEWFVRLLEAGVDVVTGSDVGLVHPPAHPDQAFVARLEEAGRRGGATIYANGQEPGFVEHMAMLATTMSNTIKRITSYELFNYSSVKNRDEMSMFFGFGDPPEQRAILEQPGVQLMVWASPLANVADLLGYTIERYGESFEKRVADRPIPVGFGTIEPGMVAAVRVRTSAWVAGREAIVVEHVNRMADDLAPEWERADAAGTMRIRIEGDPNIEMECTVGDRGRPDELAYDGYMMTAMRLINAIPHVAAAPPGIATFRTLPLTAPADALRSEATAIDHKICRSAAPA